MSIINKLSIALWVIFCMCGCRAKATSSPCTIYEMCLREKEVTYHYAFVDNKTGKIKYPWYIHSDKNGNVSIVYKMKEYTGKESKFIKQINEKEIFINATQYLKASAFGLKVDNNSYYTYYKKGDEGFQDALNLYLLSEIGCAFLKEINGETRNLNPTFAPDVTNGLDQRYICRPIYNEKGEEVPMIYIHGLETVQLPIVPQTLKNDN